MTAGHAERRFNPSQVGYKPTLSLSPVADVASFNPSQVGYKLGTTGHPATNVSVSIPHR